MLTKRLLISILSLLAATTSYAQTPGQPPETVNTIVIKTSTLKPEITAVGTFKAENGLMLKSEVAGKITGIFFNSSDRVEKGHKLVQLNPSILEAQLKLYEADLKLSQLEYQRTEKLREKNLLSKADFDKATAKLNINQARLDEAKARLQQTTLIAPFSGRVGLKEIYIGYYVQAGDPIVHLEDNDPIFVDFNIPEVYLSKVALNQKVTVRSDAAPDKTYSGKIVAKDIVANPQTRSVIMRAKLANPQWELVPGTFASIVIHLQPQSDIINVPLTAVSYSVKENFVFRVVDGKAKKTPITLGYKGANSVVVTHGLKPGDVVITVGTHKVHEGSPVIVPAAAKKK